MQSFVGAALLVAASAASAQTPQTPQAAQSPPAPPSQPKPADRSELRHHIYVMEGALARAVNFGAAKLNQEIRAVMPDMLVLAGESTARGFHLENYGVFFDVEVPVLRQSMMWSLRTMLDQDEQGATEALAQLRAFVATSSGAERAAAEAALRRIEAQLRPFGVARRAASGPGVLAGGTAAAPSADPPDPPRRPVNSLLLDDPNKAYTDAVVRALIDAMIDFSAPMTSLRPEEYLAVAARDNERRDLLAPQNPYEEVSTFMLRIRGSDLAAYRAGTIDRDEARKRVQVQEF
jgi:hypothetical protein